MAGLATVFGIVKQHDGHIQVQSEPFKGTIFTVCIPVFHSPPSVVTGASERTKPVGGGETVLLVEDEVTVRKFLALMLKRKGYTVLEAGNAADASALWLKHRADVKLLLSDMMLEGNVNGLELTKELLAQQPSLRVVLMSGYSMELLGADLSFSNSIRFIPKPFTNDEILRAIRESLGTGP